jgi:serine/threonine protein kinase
LSALKYAHAQNILHRGLHPDSLHIDSRGYLKVTDWGFAKRVTDRTYTLCGHVEYLCPEAIIHETGYGKGADYWAFGVLIYEMFVGRSPFSPGSLDYKYDVKFDDRITINTGGVESSPSHTIEDENVKMRVSLGMDRSQTVSPSSCGRQESGNDFISKSSVIHGEVFNMGQDCGTIDNILSREPIYPSYMPHPTKSIVQGLCQKNSTQRLGTRRIGKGIEDIQMHIFFQDVEWARLNKKLVMAPWSPQKSSRKDISTSTHHSSSGMTEYSMYYPDYKNKEGVQDEVLCGPAFTGYNCPDWNSFV